MCLFPRSRATYAMQERLRVSASVAEPRKERGCCHQRKLQWMAWQKQTVVQKSKRNRDQTTTRRSFEEWIMSSSVGQYTLMGSWECDVFLPTGWNRFLHNPSAVCWCVISEGWKQSQRDRYVQSGTLIMSKAGCTTTAKSLPEKPCAML